MHESTKSPTPKKVWCDGCYDLVHFGHANSFRQAKSFGDYLIVGIHTDEEIMKHKGPPVFTFEERCKLVESIKWVDEVVRGAPYVTTLEILDKNDCEFCCHGEDVTITDNGTDTYQDIKASGRYKEFERTAGISTTGLVERILAKIKQRDLEKSCERSPWTGSGNFFLTSSRVCQFSEGKASKPADTVIYVAGAFDLFHVGHLEFLKIVRSLGSYLIVGLYPDHVINQYKGENYPIMTLHERLLGVLACKYVSEVVIGAPYIVTKDLMDHFKIDVVVDGDFSLKEEKILGDPFKYPKQVSKFVRVNSGCEITTDRIVERIIKNRLEFESRNEKKEKKEIDLYSELEKGTK